ncbi:hypothetical protein J8273_6563 [Carpediemonas membranifera]|uniref:Uncharacterized protein n=1 Tax=Carpediemonas membranifera TaxID=201153 RepID=A0A8J6B2W7_9EUKA|nr:hypothetical protein J8273_6563 [Carpediemonas membranifera]|eukprot:KAG9391784.1 hypothetical protein J8273_6563 [Carpediemonas membranifera]
MLPSIDKIQQHKNARTPQPAVLVSPAFASPTAEDSRALAKSVSGLEIVSQDRTKLPFAKLIFTRRKMNICGCLALVCLPPCCSVLVLAALFVVIGFPAQASGTGVVAIPASFTLDSDLFVIGFQQTLSGDHGTTLGYMSSKLLEFNNDELILMDASKGEDSSSTNAAWKDAVTSGFDVYNGSTLLGYVEKTATATLPTTLKSNYKIYDAGSTQIGELQQKILTDQEFDLFNSTADVVATISYDSHFFSGGTWKVTFEPEPDTALLRRLLVHLLAYLSEVASVV